MSARVEPEATREVARRRDLRARALAMAGIAFAFTAPLTYVVERVLERLRAPAVDPGLILVSTHMAFVWRAVVATWFGCAAAALVFLSQRDGETMAPRAPRLMAALAGLALVIGIVALAFP